MPKCKHAVGCWYSSVWVCGHCWEQLSERPRRLGPPSTANKGGPPQVTLWSATESFELRTFLGYMTLVLVPGIRANPLDAIKLSLDYLKVIGAKFGDPSYDWTEAGAAYLAFEIIDETGKEGDGSN